MSAPDSGKPTYRAMTREELDQFDNRKQGRDLSLLSARVQCIAMRHPIMHNPAKMAASPSSVLVDSRIVVMYVVEYVGVMTCCVV